MTTPRLKTDFRVRAYLWRLEAAQCAAYILQRGDPDAGAVLVKLALLDGTARLFARHYDLEGVSVWSESHETAPEDHIDAILRRQMQSDPDLWVIEVENRAGDAMLDSDAP